MKPKHSKLNSAAKPSAEAVAKDIKRRTRRHFSAEDKIRIVLKGLRGDDSIAERCRKEEIGLEGAPQSVRAGRDTVMLATQMGRSAALEAARHASEWAYRCEDAQEGPRAFAEKRKPVWTSKD